MSSQIINENRSVETQDPVNESKDSKDQLTAEEQATKEVDLNKGRKLGDEWANWDGKLSWENVDTPSSIFLNFALGVMIIYNIISYGVYYMIAPRLNEFHPYLSWAVLGLFVASSIYFLFWYSILVITSKTHLKLQFIGKVNRFILGFLLNNVFKLGKLFKYNRDKLGNSFVKVANSFTRSTKNLSEKERLLLLLPRCLTKESYQIIRDMSKEYNVEMAVCTGGEIARKKVKEFRPSAVIGVACERDLVSGIQDVAGKVSVIGIPNIRPDGPCKNTYIDFDELRNSIEFYLSSKN